MCIQKVWKQIGMYNGIWSKLENFMSLEQISTYGEAIHELMTQHKRYQAIINQLEKAANESEKWRERANIRVKEEQKNAKKIKN